MDSFIKKIFQGEMDEKVHNQFVRFGKGEYAGRAVLTLHKTSKVKLKGSFEYANDFINLVAELGDFNFSGVVVSKEPLDLENEKKKAGAYYYEVSNVTSEKVRELAEKTYVMLLSVDSEDLKLKIKQKLPKPGKSGERKVDDKFCQLEADLIYYPQIKDTFFWDVPDCKKVKASHIYQVTSLKMPAKEEARGDFEKIRLLTKRVGKIIRKLEVDKKELKKELDFEA